MLDVKLRNVCTPAANHGLLVQVGYIFNNPQRAVCSIDDDDDDDDACGSLLVLAFVVLSHLAWKLNGGDAKTSTMYLQLYYI